MNQNSTLLTAEQVAKTFPLPAGGEQTVLEEVTLVSRQEKLSPCWGAAGPVRGRSCVSWPVLFHRPAAESL